jgi:hypothetical protein
MGDTHHLLMVLKTLWMVWLVGNDYWEGIKQEGPRTKCWIRDALKFRNQGRETSREDLEGAPRSFLFGESQAPLDQWSVITAWQQTGDFYKSRVGGGQGQTLESYSRRMKKKVKSRIIWGKRIRWKTKHSNIYWECSNREGKCGTLKEKRENCCIITLLVGRDGW